MENRSPQELHKLTTQNRCMHIVNRPKTREEKECRLNGIEESGYAKIPWDILIILHDIDYDGCGEAARLGVGETVISPLERSTKLPSTLRIFKITC